MNKIVCFVREITETKPTCVIPKLFFSGKYSKKCEGTRPDVKHLRTNITEATIFTEYNIEKLHLLPK